MFASFVFFFLAFIIIYLFIYLFILFVCLGMACLTTPIDINSFFLVIIHCFQLELILQNLE